MRNSEDLWFIRYYGELLVYWYDRFDTSRDVEDLDRALRYLEPLKEHLPFSWKDAPLKEIVNLIKGLPASGPKRDSI